MMEMYEGQHSVLPSHSHLNAEPKKLKENVPAGGKVQAEIECKSD